MTDPAYICLAKPQIPPRFRDYPHRLALLPGGMTLEKLGSAPHVCGCFLIDTGCGSATLNEPALAGYLTARVPILLHAQRPKDLRPFLKRAAVFRARGFELVLLP